MFKLLQLLHVLVKLHNVSLVNSSMRIVLYKTMKLIVWLKQSMHYRQKPYSFFTLMMSPPLTLTATLLILFNVYGATNTSSPLVLLAAAPALVSASIVVLYQ